MKAFLNIIVFVFILSITLPNIQDLVNDKVKLENKFEAEETEKEDFEKEDLNLFDKIIFTNKIEFPKIIIITLIVSVYYSINQQSQFKAIFSPPPEK